MKKTILGLSITVTTLTLLLSACDPLISQNPSDTFWDKKFPKQLEWIRSQMRELSLKEQEKIIARVKTDQQRKDLLKVAVIDGGVDIAHDDLQGQIDYRIKDDHIVGAGFDIMGDGAFASHVLINPTLFAFGANSLREGRIVNAPESPLKLLEQINNRFRDLIMQGIKEDPVLSQGLFSKLNRESFTVLGFANIKKDKEDFIESYEQHKKQNDLVNSTTIAEGHQKHKVKDIQNSWAIMTDDQRPQALSYIESIEGGDHFINLIAKTYETIDTEMAFSKKVALFNQFKNILDRKPDIHEDEDLFPDDLKKAMEFVIYGADSYDPIKNLERLFQGQDQYKELSFADAFRKYHADKMQQLDTMLKRTDLIKEHRQALEKNKSEMEIFGNLVENIIALEKDSSAYKKMRSDLRRFVYRTKHPYIAEDSNSNSHATHVSGVIAKQHPNIRIVPVRVTTQTIVTSKERQQETVDKLLSKFKSFTESPYYAPLKEEISREYGNIKVSDRTVLTKVKGYLKANVLNALFIDDVLKAVEVCGREKVKVANVSLGTTFQKSYSLDKKVASFVEDLFSEFARFDIGNTIKEKAPGTLFMIATGNDGGWIDGISKTAFPVGITSMRLIKIAKEKGLAPTPNNSVKNVLAVASINPNGTLTPFTNILLDPNIPQIFSTGEEIKSTVPGKSMDATSHIVHAKIRKLLSLFATMSQVSLRDAEDLSMEEQAEQMDKERIDTDIMFKMPDYLNTLVHITEPIDRENMSGTSMATPTVTGIVARYIAEKMHQENISSDQVYEHPLLKPEVIVSDVMKMSHGNSLTPMITVQMLVEGIKTWDKSHGESVQRKSINNLLKPRCENLFGK
ncbi:MAG: S8 family serine peptidase [Bdellovibrio sp.]